MIKYDKQLVCATAGLWRKAARRKSNPNDDILPKLNIQALGIVQTYRDEVLAKGGHQSMSEILAGLSAAIRWRFNVQADLNDYLGHSPEEIINEYRLQLILAGIDTDGKLKIGRIEIGVTQQRGFDGVVHWTANEFIPTNRESSPLNCPRLTTVENELVICSAGIDTIEKDMRANPEHYTHSPIMQEFISVHDRDRGASLSLDYLKKLGDLFKLETEPKDKRVGGSDQIAVIRRGSDVDLKIPDGLAQIKNQEPFSVAVCKPGAGGFIGGDTFSTTPTIFESCTFSRARVLLDGNVYVHCSFHDSELVYLGGDNTLFDDDNRIEGNSFLSGGPNSCWHPGIMNRLAEPFDFEHGGINFPGPGRRSRFCDQVPSPTIPFAH